MIQQICINSQSVSRLKLYSHVFSQSEQLTIIMCRLSNTLIALVVLATLLKENSCFTLHRLDQTSDDQREVFIDTQQPATATGIDDETSPSQDRFKRSAISPTSASHHQLTADEWQLVLQEMIAQHNFDTSDEIHHSDALLANQQHLDVSSEEDRLDDQRWDQVKDAEWLKKFFGVTWESVKDMKFDHTSTEDLIEDWLRKQHLSS